MTEFEPVYLSRPGAEAMVPAVPDVIEEVSPGIWCSPGLTNVFMIPTSEGVPGSLHLPDAGSLRPRRRTGQRARS